jgi:hypothetical protein
MLDGEDIGMMARRFVFVGQDVVVSQRFDLGLGGGLWNGATVLAHYLEHRFGAAPGLQGALCLDLGCGTAQLGIVLSLLGGSVDCTDMPESLLVAATNLRRNVPAAMEAGQCRLLEYTWGAPHSHLRAPYRYILACECIYRDAPMPELVGALVELSDAQTDIYVCYKWRKNSPIALFFDLIAPHFEAHQVSAEELQMAAMDCGEPFDLHDLHLYILRRKAPALEHAVS